jgi:hypothetical protein
MCKPTSCAIPLVLVAILTLPGGLALAGTVSSFGPEQAAKIKDFIPIRSGSEWYKENWNHNAWTAEGHFIAVDFIISNIGVGDGKAKYKAMLRMPSGKVTKCVGELDSGQWQAQDKSFDLKFAKVHVKGDLKGADVKVRCKNIQMDLRFDNLAPPYKPGRGALKFGDQGIYRKGYPSARARVTGTIRAKGTMLKIDAPGMIENSAFTLAPHEFSQRWFRFRHVADDVTILLSELQTPDDYGRVRRGWAMVYDDTGRLLASSKVRFDYDGYIEDKRSKQGYRIPRRVRFAAVDGQTHLTGQILMTSLRQAKDPTQDWNVIVRSMARRFSKPMKYYINSTYSLRIVNKEKQIDRKFEGKNEYQFGYINP